LWGWVDREKDFGFTSVVDRKTLQQEGSETTTGSTTERVENHETLKTGTLVSLFTKSVKNKVDNFFTDGVVTTGVIIGGIFLSGDELFWVEQLAVRTRTDFVNDGWFQIKEDSTGDVFTSTSFGEESTIRVVVGIIIVAIADGWFLPVRLNAVLEAEKFPTRITELDTGLTDMDS